MAKLQPEERWRIHVRERFIALEQSGGLKALRAEGLAILKRKKLLTPEEWWQTFSQRTSSPDYRAWHDKCRTLGERFGLAPWTITMACLLEGYKPEEQRHVMEAEWPKVKIVTESTDPLFLARLAYEAQKRGLYVIQRQGSVESTYLYLHPVPIDALEPPPLPPSKPPLYTAFRIKVETPIGYPSEAARTLQKEAGQVGKELLKCLGYEIPQRLRSSKLVSMAEQLRVTTMPLRKNEAYDISDDIYNNEVGGIEDQKRRKLVASQRIKVHKRLIKPYEEPDV